MEQVFLLDQITCLIDISLNWNILREQMLRYISVNNSRIISTSSIPAQSIVYDFL